MTTCEANSFVDHNLHLLDFSEEDDYLIALPYRDSLEDLRFSVTFDNVNEWNNHVRSESIIEPRRHSFLRKSLAWDSAFFTNAGVLNPQELMMINTGFKTLESPTTQNICSQNKVKSHRAKKNQSPNLQGTNGMVKMRITDRHIMQDKVFLSNNNTAVENVKTKNKTRKAGAAQDLSMSKRLPNSTSFPSPTTEKKSKAHCAYESSSSASSSSKDLYKSLKRRVKPKDMKLINSPSSVHFSLSSSTCSSTTSPANSIDGWLSESLSLTSITTPVLDFHSQNVTRSSEGTTAGRTKRKIKASGLRMPSPKIGFFDEEPIFNPSMQSGLRGRPNENELKDGRKPGSSCSKLKPTSKEILKMNSDPKRQKPNHGEKENVCSFENQVSGLCRQFEVIDLEKKLKSQLVCSRTPLAKNIFLRGVGIYGHEDATPSKKTKETKEDTEECSKSFAPIHE